MDINSEDIWKSLFFFTEILPGHIEAQLPLIHPFIYLVIFWLIAFEKQGDCDKK